MAFKTCRYLNDTIVDIVVKNLALGTIPANSIVREFLGRFEFEGV